ncbi:MAG: hypothetical protein ACOC78_02870 [Actinomycetota bacterium]
MVAAGSDYPLVPMDPFLQMNVMVNGTDVFGNPPVFRQVKFPVFSEQDDQPFWAIRAWVMR